MQDKRYQVFLSSTFEDLKVERRSVEETIMRSGDFPVTMEGFPATDDDQFEFIKSLISSCDYYVLIVAGRYGTQTADGLSYTEKEYRYAVSQNIPVLVFLREGREELPLNKSEGSDAGRKKLENFVREISTKRVRKSWSTLDGLKLSVREALDHAKATKPRPGWVRGDSVASIETLQELNELRKSNEKFRSEIGDLSIDIPLPDIPSHDGPLPFTIFARAKALNPFARNSLSVETTWLTVFPYFYDNMKWHSHDDYNDTDNGYWFDRSATSVSLGSSIASELSGADVGDNFAVSENFLGKLFSYYIEVGLANSERSDEPFSQIADRYARRHSLSTVDGRPAFKILNGEISSRAASSNDLDDEIPF